MQARYTEPGGVAASSAAPLPETEVPATDLAALVCALLGRHAAPAYTEPVLWESVW